MLGLLINAAMLIAQPATARPVAAAYAFQGGGDQIERLLDEWSGAGVIRRAGRAGKTDGFAQCIAPRHPRDIDVACIRRLTDRRGRGPATVAIIAVDSGRRNLVYDVRCIGPDGVGRTDLNPTVGPFTYHAPLRDRARAGLASCLSAALRGSVVANPGVQAEPSSPPAAAFLIEAPGREPDRLGLHRLIFESWRSRGGVRPLEQRRPLPDWSACLSGQPRRLDPACVQRLLPWRDDHVRVVALIVLPSPDRFHRLTLHCVGARGVGSTAVIHPLATIDRSNPTSRLSNNGRSGIAQCINQAAPGTVTGNTW